MDEAEKYQQRLQAIAEKRRLQEEQDRARREMDDEKLRLQQLKRKSLRDQWLMEGPQLSPTSPDAQSPRSPLWGSQAQEIEKRIDKLQTESQRLAEEEEKLKEQMEDGQMEAVNVAEAAAEVVQSAVVQNGEEKASGSDTTEDVVKKNLSLLQDEMAPVLTNGGGEGEIEANHDTLEENALSSTNGLMGVPDGTVTMTFLGYSEAEPDQVPNVKINEEEEEEGTVVMRAERVIITDDRDDKPEDISTQEEQREAGQVEDSPQPKPEEPEEGGEAAEEVVEAEAAPDTSTEPEGEKEMSETVSPTAEAEAATGDGDTEGDLNENGDGGTKTEGEEDHSGVPTSVQPQSPADALEGTTVASVPVYSEAQPSPLTTEAEPEAEAAATPEDGAPQGVETASVAQDAATLPGQFQEVSLADPQEHQRTETGPGEQEPLLSQAKAPQTQAEPAAVSSPASTETYTPTRANQGGETAAPKRKTCQCCSVM